MTVYGYNFNDSTSLTYYLQCGYQTFSSVSVYDSDLEYYTYRLYVYYKNAIVSPPLAASVTTVRVKCYMLWTGADQQYFLICYDSNVAYQLMLIRTSTGALALYNGAGTLLATSDPALLRLNVAYNIEMYANIDSDDGFVHLYINGQEIFSDVSSSDQFYAGDTQNTAYGVRYVGARNVTTIPYYIYDIIIDDDPDADTPIGNQYVLTMRPSATLSASDDVTTSDESDPDAVLAQVSPDGDPYVALPASGDTVQLSFDGLGDYLVTVSAVGVKVYWEKNGVGDCSGQLDFTVGDSSVSGTAQALSNSYTGQTEKLTGTLALSDVKAMTATITRTA